MTFQRKIPVFFRVLLALALDAVIAFGPIALGLYLKPRETPAIGVIVLGAVWLFVFHRFLLWRLDCFWNLRTLQNRTGMPEKPDNLRTFRTLRGWMGWLLLGKDYEQ